MQTYITVLGIPYYYYFIDTYIIYSELISKHLNNLYELLRTGTCS